MFEDGFETLGFENFTITTSFYETHAENHLRSIYKNKFDVLGVFFNAFLFQPLIKGKQIFIPLMICYLFLFENDH